MKKWFLGMILFGSLTITIPDAKDAKVLQARDLYNARTSQSLTIQQWVKLVVREAVVAELVRSRQQEEDAAAQTLRDDFTAALNAERSTTDSVLSVEQGGWE